MTSISKQFGQLPFQYVNGFGISNDATTPNTVLKISAGSCLDSTATFQCVTSSALTISSGTVGLNGLDTGTLTPSSMYGVYVVFDPVTQQPTGGMISLSLTGPLMPLGYSAFRLVGFVKVDGTSFFVKGYWSAADASSRSFRYDTNQATAIVAGNAIVFTAINLIASVPNVNNTRVDVVTVYTPNAASNFASLQPANATGTAVTTIGQVASVSLVTGSELLAQQTVISLVLSPAINYKVSSATDAVAVSVAGYKFVL